MILKIKKKLVSGILAFSLLTTSFGGAVAAANPAVPAESEAVQKETSKDGILIGLAAVGLIAALSNHGDSGNNSSGGSSSGSSGSSGSLGSSSSAVDEQQAIALLNKDRAAYGLPALKANFQLTTLARNYAQDMINRGYFSHYNPEGQSPFDRMKQAGITYKSAGENLAINTSVAGAQAAFMASSGHRANVLNSSYTDVGIGVVRSPSGSVYVVQEFISK